MRLEGKEGKKGMGRKRGKERGKKEEGDDVWCCLFLHESRRLSEFKHSKARSIGPT